MPDPLKMIRAAHEAKEHFDEMLRTPMSRIAGKPAYQPLSA
jgi:hypothetical protein